MREIVDKLRLFIPNSDSSIYQQNDIFDQINPVSSDDLTSNSSGSLIHEELSQMIQNFGNISFKMK
jgi:hypothetical protein